MNPSDTHAEVETGGSATSLGLAPWQACAGSLVIFAGFYVLYFTLGSLVVPLEPALDLFGADLWVHLDRDAEFRHMLVPILLEPFTVVARQLTRTTVGEVAALNAAFGALAVALAFQVFLRLVRAVPSAALLTLLYGVSMSQLLFSSIPETYAIGATGIVATYLVFLVALEAGRVPFLSWFAVAVWTIGITTSNVAQTAVAYAAASRVSPGPSRVARGAVLLLAVIGAVVVLLRLQPSLLGTNDLLSMAQVREEFVDFVAEVAPPPRAPEEDGLPPPLHSEARSIQQLAVNYLILGFVGGRPGQTPYDPKKPTIEYLGHPLSFTPVGTVATVLWLSLWIAGLVMNARAARARSRWPPAIFFGALVVIVAGNLAFFTLYNPIEMYLYSLLTIFPILLLGVNGHMFRKARWMGLLAVLVVLVAINNLGVIRTLIASGAAP